MGIKFDKEIQGILLLGSILDTWEILKTSLSNSTPDGIISMDLAKSSVLNEEMRKQSHRVHSLSQMFWLLSIRGEATVMFRNTKIKVGASIETGTKMLSVTIVIKRDI